MARALIPEDERFHVSVSPSFEGGTELTVPFVESYYRYFLMPRRMSEGAPWVICYACDRGGVRPVGRDRLGGHRGHLDPEGRPVSLHALAGLAFLNVLFALCGAAQLWWVRGWATLGELARLAGLAYLLGVATVGALWTLLLIVGVPLSLWVAVAVPSLATLVIIVLARRSGRDLPRIDRAVGRRGLLATAVGNRGGGRVLRGPVPCLPSLWAPVVGRVVVLGSEGEGDLLTSATSTWSSSRRYRGRRTHRSSRYSMLRRSGSWGAQTS